MIKTLLLVTVASLLPALAPAQVRLLRHPTYSNGKVAFSYLGDIWIANEDGTGIQRLTDNIAREIYPRFSPDGKWLAFSSDREGNYDVYVIPVEGGKPRQLTFHSAADNVVNWTPDGGKIIFQSSRDDGVFPGVGTLYEIPAAGGMEQPLGTDWGSWASYSADGSKLAFTRHPGVWSRKHYRGSYAVDLWLEDVAKKTFTRLGGDDYKGNYLWPMYGHDGFIYYVADELANEKNLKFGGPEVMKSINNIWKIPDHGGKAVQVTHVKDANLAFPSMSADGKTIVYEDEFTLWKLDVATGKSTELKLDIKSDSKDNESGIRTFDSEADAFNLSPTTRRAAIVTHGEIFTIATDRGEIQRVTETPWLEEDPRWSPDGNWIAFVSDRTGRQEIWMSDELGHKLKQLSDVDCDKSSLIWAADSKALLWTGSDHKLRRVNVEDGKTEVLVSSDVGPIGTPQFSPDGKWLSYSRQDNQTRSHVYLRNLESGEEIKIEGESFVMSSGAKWTPDGKRLLLIGGVGAPAMSSLNRTTTALYSVAFQPMDKNPSDERDINTEAQAKASEATPSAGGGRGAGGRGRGGAGAGGASTNLEVKIDTNGIERRITQLSTLTGINNIVPSPDGQTYAFVAGGGGGGGAADAAGAGPGLYTIAEDGTRLTRINTAVQPTTNAPGRGRGGGGGGGFGEPQWSRDGRTLYYAQGGGIYAASVGGGGGGAAPAPAAGGGGRGGGGGGRRGGGGGGGGAAAAAATATDSGTAPRRLSFTVRMEIDDAAERRETFIEAWRTMKIRFYDAKMHGVDWAAARAIYEPLLPFIADNDELHNVIMQMIGELNASHTGITGGGNATPGTERVQTRYPGFNLAPDAAGFFKVAYIYKKGPADHEYVNLHVGDYILAVNGREMKTTDNYWRMFNLIPGRRFEFTVNSKPQMDGSWTVPLDPLNAAAQSNLEYDRWVNDRKAMVDKLSAGKVGYLHIKAMDAPSLQKFERDLLDNLDKKALIIDERFNGGGGIDQELLEILNQRKQYGFYRGRDSVDVPRPVQAFFGPMAVLQNERSASNAEMFPGYFRELGLGKVIGVPTYGAVIGTGAFRLMDGSSLRTPSFGVYEVNGQNFENYGVPPDVNVDNTPADFLTGHDRQIEKAVEVLTSEIKK